MRTRAARLRVTSDYDFLSQNCFDLQPVATALGHILAVGAFGHHSFQTKLLNLAIESLALAVDVFGKPDDIRGLEYLSEPRLPLNHRARSEVVTVNVDQIEDKIDNRRALSVEAFSLQELKTGNALRVQSADLSIKDRLFGAHLFGDLRQLGILTRHFDLIA